MKSGANTDAEKRRPVVARILGSALVFAIVAGVCSYSLCTKCQILNLQGMGEDYYQLGWDLEASGSLSADGSSPGVFRPPGYPLFIAAVLDAWGYARPNAEMAALSGEERTDVVNGAHFAIYYAQGILLALTAALAFWWLSRRLGVCAAFVASVLLGTNPYLVICVGFLHYEVLHVFFIVAGAVAIDVAFSAQKGRTIGAFIAGIVVGLGALVRPMTMILPFVGLVFLPLFLQKRSKSLLVPLCFLALGMAVAIAPCTARNYIKTGRLIPINAQSWVAVWTGSIAKDPPDADHFQWWSIYSKGGARIVRSVSKTGTPSTVWFQKPVALEDAFHAAAIANLKRSPETYLTNGVRSFVSYNADFNTLMIRLFESYQLPQSTPTVKTCLMNLPCDLPGENTANWFGYFLNALGVLALCGAALAIYRRDAGMICVFITYLTLALAHAVTFIDFFYYYSKIPFLCVFTGYFIAEVGRYKSKIAIRGRGVPTVGLLGAVLLAANIALLAAMM